MSGHRPVAQAVLLASTLGVALLGVWSFQPGGVLGFAEDGRVALGPLERGVVEDTLVQAGDAVKAGQIVARLHPGDLEAEIGEVEARIAMLDARMDAATQRTQQSSDDLRLDLVAEEGRRASARAAVEVLERRRDDQRRWVDEGLVGPDAQQATEADLIEARARLDAIERNVGALRGALGARSEADDPSVAAVLHQRESYLRRLEGLLRSQEARVLRAPFDGRVVSVWVREGGAVDAGMPVVEVVPERSRRVIACTAEAEVDQAPVGTSVVVHEVGTMTPHRGVISAVSPVVVDADPRCRTWAAHAQWVRPVYVELEGEGAPSGVRVTVRLDASLPAGQTP